MLESRFRVVFHGVATRAQAAVARPHFLTLGWAAQVTTKAR